MQQLFDLVLWSYGWLLYLSKICHFKCCVVTVVYVHIQCVKTKIICPNDVTINTKICRIFGKHIIAFSRKRGFVGHNILSCVSLELKLL